ncbi:MAG TPA: hypothetical protein VJ954_07740 [Ignavibacteriaceae bacterium]|nr:hypothetical protein [Ignavibacteriaceae bacterium]
MNGRIKMALLGIAIVAIFSAAIMILWNLLVPEIIGLKAINFWQAAGLFILTRILFGGFWGGKPHDRQINDFQRGNHMREKWMKMSDEERKEFINKRREFFRGGSFNPGDIFENKSCEAK